MDQLNSVPIEKWKRGSLALAQVIKQRILVDLTDGFEERLDSPPIDWITGDEMPHGVAADYAGWTWCFEKACWLYYVKGSQGGFYDSSTGEFFRLEASP